MGESDEKLDQRNAPRLKALRRDLRRQQTSAEAVLWQRLRNRQLQGSKFKRQYAIGSYILDFYCAEAQLAIELDGAVHDDVARRTYDDERTVFLMRQGIRVVRFENKAVFEDLDLVLAAIMWHLDNAPFPDDPDMSLQGSNKATYVRPYR